MKKILKHFKTSDHLIYKMALEYGLDRLVPAEPKFHFEKMCRVIVGQQLSVKAAAIINQRFLELFGGRLDPELIWTMEDQKMRDVGMSWAKIKYVKDLARQVKEDLLDLESLDELKNEEVIEKLVAVKGIGRWTAELFCMFSLGREDLFSARDLGLRRAMERLYELDPSVDRVYEKIAEKWSPYRTYACQVLWKSLDNEPKGLGTKK